MNARHRAFLVVSVTSVSFSLVANAEPTSADKSLATQLFKEGRTLVDQGKYSEGCKKLEESQRLDPGGGTLLNLALCHEKEGRTATAWAEFTEALGIARKDDRPQRAEIAQQHIDALEPTLSRLIVQVNATADLPDLEVRRDGTAIRRAAWSTAMPIDPGDHIIEAVAPGKIGWKQTISVGSKAETKTISVPTLDNAPVVAAPPVVPTQPGTFIEVRKPVNPAAWVAFGLGAAGLGVGTYFGISAMSNQKTADDNCPKDICNKTGTSANGDAIRAANLATVGFGVGAVGLGLGTYLLLTRGTANVPASGSVPRWVAAHDVRVDVSPQNVSVGGAW